MSRRHGAPAVVHLLARRERKRFPAAAPRPEAGRRRIALLSLAGLALALPRLPAQDPLAEPGPTPVAEAAAAGESSRMAVRAVAGRLVARVELSTPARRIPANLWVDLDRPAGFELHGRAAQALGFAGDGSAPVTLHLLGSNLAIAEGGPGDEKAMEDFTRLHSRELGEVPLIGALGSTWLSRHHLVIDLSDGFITLSPPADATGAAPAESAGSVVAAATIAADLLRFPVRLADGSIRTLALGSSRHDTIADRDLCEGLGRPAGDIGPVLVKTIDLARYVALRPEPLAALGAVAAEGSLGVTGLGLLAHFRVEIDFVNRWIRFAETAPAEFPLSDLEFFRARATGEGAPLATWLAANPGSRLAREGARRLLDLRIAERADLAACREALEWLDRTTAEDLRTTEALRLADELAEGGHADLAIEAGRIGIASGRKDRYPEAVHALHRRLGELLLGRGESDAAWEHLLSAAFGLPDDGEVNLLLGRLYEEKGSWRRAQSRYVQAVIRPESGEAAVAGLERVQGKLAGEPLSVDLVDRMVRGKVHNFSAATKFEPTPETATNRCALVELFTNPHFGRPQGETWESFAIGGAMAIEGLLGHFGRDRAVVLVHAIDLPEPSALATELGAAAFDAYGLDGPVSTVIDGRSFGPGAERWRNAEAVYEENRALVLAELARPSEVAIAISAELDPAGSPPGTVRGTVRVEGPAGDRRVQAVLVERGVLYPGKALIVVHRMVARGSLLGSIPGLPYEPREGGQTFEFSRTLAEITAENVRFLERREAAGGAPASRLSVAIDPRQVSIVAFVRSGTAGEVLQAAQLDLGAADGARGDR